MAEKESSLTVIIREIKEYLALNVSNARLTVAEKSARLMSTVALAIVIFVLGVIAFFFLSFALVRFIALAIPIEWAYLVMAALYVVLIVVAVALRRQLIVNPITRFITRLILK